MSEFGPRAPCLAGAALLAVACQAIVGIEDSPPLRHDAGVGGDASSDGSAGLGASGGAAGASGTGGAAGSAGMAGSDAGVDAGCGSAQPPAATAGADPGGNIEFVVVIRQIDLGDKALANGPSWPTLGYDLDKLCTCGSDPSGSCKPIKSVVCDGAQGRDNAIGAMLAEIKSLFNIPSLSSDNLNAKIDAGGNTVLIRVRGYNGTADDASVDVAWFASDDFKVSNANPPKWDGTDEWPVLYSSIVAGTDADGGPTYSVENPKYEDKAAFVSNGTLVANIPEGLFSLTAKTAIPFTAGLFTAKVQSTSGGAWSLENAVLAGITSSSDILGVLPSIDDPLLNKPICMDNLLYATIKGLICSYADMTVLANPAKSCDHLSFGLTSHGDPAKLGVVSFLPSAPSKCAPGKDPATDSC